MNCFVYLFDDFFFMIGVLDFPLYMYHQMYGKKETKFISILVEMFHLGKILKDSESDLCKCR